MFGMGMGELIVIVIVALLVLGPDKLPEAAKTLSKGIRDFRKQTRELQKTIEDDNEIGGAIRDLKSALRGEELHTSSVQAREQQRKAAEAVSKVAGAEAARKLAEGEATAEAADAEASSESGAAAPGDSGTGTEADDDMPVFRPPAGAVATSRAVPGASANDQPDASHESESVTTDADNAHG